jgi:sulfoxide reductase heme-binding subunit YedZ
VKKRFITPLHLVAHLAALIPLVWLIIDWQAGQLSVNPIQDATRRLGLSALIVLLASLTCRPFYTLTGYAPILRLRKPLGLYAFGYAALHLYLFIGVDYGFAWNLLWLDIANKRYIFVGLAAFLILASMAATSFASMKKRLGKNWKRLHTLVYGAILLVILHFAWVIKGDVTRLSGDILQPVLFGLYAILLLALRLPPVRAQAIRLREEIKRRRIEHSLRQATPMHGDD